MRLALIGLVGIAACGALPQHGTAGARDTALGPPVSFRAALPRISGALQSSALLSILIEPAAGMAPIYALLGSARHALDLTMYALEDTRAEQLLAVDATGGVDVRVIVKGASTGARNEPALRYLQGHGVHVRWAGSLYALTHEKTLVVDGSVAAIMTLNWTSRFYATTRDVAVIDHRTADIEAIQKTFDADYNQTPVEPASGAGLVWSPTTALPELLALINGATRELDVENEEMGSATITGALIAAARRGVNVAICMTDSSNWSSAFGELTAAGVHVRVYAPDAPLYIHAKAIVRDPGAGDQQAFVGSQNFSTQSLEYNRELGITLSSSTVIEQLVAMFRGDDMGAAPWTA